MKYVPLFLITLLLGGCAGKVDYTGPTAQPGAANNSKIIEKARDSVWNSSVPELGKQFFVINNIDKSSGLINISYSGDPEKYIDCGRVKSYVKNARGERTYEFPGAKAQQQYEVMNGQGLFSINRRLSLEGRVNVVFEEIAKNQTKVTANTKYVLQRQITVIPVANNIPQTSTDTITFNYGGRGAFSPNKEGQVTECLSTGALESEILSAIK